MSEYTGIKLRQSNLGKKINNTVLDDNSTYKIHIHMFMLITINDGRPNVVQ